MAINSKNQFKANLDGYFIICIETEGKKAEKISNWWLANNALAVDFEPTKSNQELNGEPEFLNEFKISNLTYIWKKAIANVLVNKDINVEDKIMEFLSQAEFSNSKVLSIDQLENQNWLLKYRKDFQPIILDKIAIIASWHRPLKNKININIDPGMAFGSGSHPTTKMILQYLENQPIKNLKVLDYGCGSGILGICAAKFGGLVTLTDIDEIALKISKKNCKINNIKAKIIKTDQLNGSFDLILANILLDPILKLKSKFARIIKPKGKILIAGILNNQFSQVTKQYRQENFLKIKLSIKLKTGF